jgi:predicted lipase
MNDLEFALACQESYVAGSNKWLKTWFINNVQVSLTRINRNYVLVFRGSMLAVDWMRDVEAIPVFHKSLGWCHKGFVEGLDDVFQAIKGSTGGEPVSFTGHSLGGARARLMAGMFVVAGLPIIDLVTFGSPKPAFDQLSDILTRSTINHRSYRNMNDVVPTLPPTEGPILNWQHTEQYVTLNGGGDDEFTQHEIENYVKGVTCLIS